MPRGHKRLQPKLGVAGILDLLLALELAVALDTKPGMCMHVHFSDFKIAATHVSGESQSVVRVTHMKIYTFAHMWVPL